MNKHWHGSRKNKVGKFFLTPKFALALELVSRSGRMYIGEVDF